MDKFETGKRLRQSRLEAGYKTARSFAAKYDIAHATYSMHEAGRRGLKPLIAHRYAKILDVSTAWLLTGEGYKKPNPDKSFSVPLIMRTGVDKFNNSEKSNIILPTSQKMPEGSFAVEVSAVTKNKKFKKGDIIFCAPPENIGRALNEDDQHLYRLSSGGKLDILLSDSLLEEKDGEMLEHIGILMASFVKY